MKTPGEGSIITVVLAAGKGQRLGGPKALLAWPSPRGDRPLAIAHADARLDAESERALLVVRQRVATTLLAYVRPGIDLVVSHADDELGPAGSLSVVAARLKSDDAALVIVTPVDTPPASAETVSALVARLVATPGAAAARPLFGGHGGGHPVVLRRSALAVFDRVDPPTLRDALTKLGADVVTVDVDDANVRADLDTPVDVAKLLGGFPRFMTT